MYKSSVGHGFVGALLFLGALIGALIGAAAIALGWLFVIYVWPSLKAWLHAITG